jgi:hypothetical protein
MMARWPPATWVDEAVRLYESGVGISTITIVIGKAEAAIHYQFRKRGVKMRTLREASFLRWKRHHSGETKKFWDSLYD